MLKRTEKADSVPKKEESIPEPVPDLKNRPRPYQKQHSFLGIEFEDEDRPNFNEPANRRNFTSMVLIVITLQLIVTVLLSMAFFSNEDCKNAVVNNSWVILVCVVVLVVPYFMIVCCESTRREFPTNVILLFFLTIGIAGTSATCTAWFETIVIIYTLALTVVVLLYTIVIANISPIHFCSWKWVFGSLFIFLILFTALAFGLSSGTQYPFSSFIWPGIFIAFFAAFLLHDLKAIMGGHRDIHIGPSSVVLGTGQIYADVVGLFIAFLEIVGTITEND